jgi:predicted NBD/HSP70 family sugar kinase
LKTLAIDIGGAGAKSAIFEKYTLERSFALRDVPDVDVDLFGNWVANEFGKDFDAISLGIPGVIDPVTQTILHAFHPRWKNVRPDKSIRNATKARTVVLMNDAEAHAYSSRNYPLPLIQLVLGSGLGFSVLDHKCQFLRPQHGSLDIGQFRARSNLSNDAVWYALSSRGLRELEAKHPQESDTIYAGLVSEFVVGTIVMFQPKTVVLSGGIVESRPEIIDMVAIECRKRLPVWYTQSFEIPVLVRSENPRFAGLRGLAAAAMDGMVI